MRLSGLSDLAVRARLVEKYSSDQWAASKADNLHSILG
jgi:hypothetical protein